MLLDQAIFTSARTTRQAGYHLVAISGGVSELECRDLVGCGPTHDSLYPLGDEPRSINFQHLVSRRYAISRTVFGGSEYSGRAGERVYTHYLLCDEEVLGRFGNDPFALLEAVERLGALTPRDSFPPQLPTIALPEAAFPAPPWEPNAKAQFNADQIADLLRQVMAQPALGLALDGGAEQLIRGLIQLLPPPLRLELTFVTGLVYSPRRRVRLQVLPDQDFAEHRRFTRLSGARVIQLASVVPTV